jgi:hypothetical protein
MEAAAAKQNTPAQSNPIQTVIDTAKKVVDAAVASTDLSVSVKAGAGVDLEVLGITVVKVDLGSMEATLSTQDGYGESMTMGLGTPLAGVDFKAPLTPDTAAIEHMRPSENFLWAGVDDAGYSFNVGFSLQCVLGIHGDLSFSVTTFKEKMGW